MGAMQSVVRLALPGNYPVVSVHQQDIHGHLEALPEFLSLPVAERFPFVGEHVHRPPRLRALPRGVGQLAEGTRQSR
jgi:hypothetical protein